jgi:uncharacterized protein
MKNQLPERSKIIEPVLTQLTHAISEHYKDRLDKAINEKIMDYIKLIQNKYTDFETVYVFGSYARGNSNQDSDIDLALIFRDLDDSKRFDLQVQLMLLASQIDTRI